MHDTEQNMSRVVHATWEKKSLSDCHKSKIF